MTESVLIVDDAALMRLMQRNILEAAGYFVAGEAVNGVESVKKYKELRPGIVLMNLTMPEMDGIEATRQIMKINRSAKIIMCSAMGQASMVLQSILAGASYFVVQPFEQEGFIDDINYVTENECETDFKKADLLLRYDTYIYGSSNYTSLSRGRIKELFRMCQILQK